jgi:hypothetical protein
LHTLWFGMLAAPARPTAMPLLKTRAGVMSSSQHLPAHVHSAQIAGAVTVSPHRKHLFVRR